MEKDVFKREVGQRVAGIREEKELLAEKLAETAEISPVTLSRIECGERAFYTTTLFGICQALGVSADYILGLAPRNDDKDVLLQLSKLSSREKKLVTSFIQGLIDTYHT